MWLLLLALLALISTACRSGPAAPPVADPATRRTTPQGDVVGFVGRYGNHAWLGLPYAAPPVGELRWREPRPPAAWTGTREALRFGAPCVQYASPLGGIRTEPADTPVGSEDCLTANVYAPADATPASRLPVLVWIHGGGNTIGAAELYDGGNLAEAGDVVVVTVNYRLGPFGWFRHAALREGATSDAERSGNFATLDLVRALEWIRDTIPAFGGDPERVTVFGESAGGTNTLTLLLSPRARGLFHRAIVQSGGLREQELAAAEAFADDAQRAARRERGRPPAENGSNDVLARLLVRDGRAADVAAAKQIIATMPSSEIAAFLRAQPAYEVLGVYEPIPGIGMIEMPSVFADGHVLPKGRLVDSFARPDGWNRMPVILGTNRDESKLFMFGSPDWISWRFWILPRLRDPEGYDRSAAYLSRLMKADGADAIARAIVTSGTDDVFVYRFDWDEEPTILGSDLSRMLGAAHGIEIPFVFGHFDFGERPDLVFTPENEAGRLELSSAMMRLWASFAKEGTPGAAAPQSPTWPAWDASGRFLVLDTKAGGGIRPETEVLSRESLVESVASDPNLDARQRCIVYHDLVAWGEALDRSAYDARCPAHPFEGYPWHG